MKLLLIFFVLFTCTVAFLWDNKNLTKLPDDSHRIKRQAIINKNVNDYRWPTDKPIAYAFNDDIDAKSQIIVHQVAAYFSSMTCLKFIEDATPISRIQIATDWNNSTVCWSFIGWYPNNTRQFQLIPDCKNFASVAHEFIHLMGVYHQDERYDRDEYLINATSKLRTINNTENYDVPFDYGSAMMVASMISKDPLYQASLGNRLGPTFGDLLLINRRYNCTCPTATTTCANGGYLNSNGCDKCICPHGFSGPTCSERDLGTDGAGETINVTDKCQTLNLTLESTNETFAYKKIWYHFIAPAGKKVQFVITKLNACIHQGCGYNGIEMKLFKDKFDRTGYLICGKNKNTFLSTSTNPKAFTSDTEFAMLQFYTRMVLPRDTLQVQIAYYSVDSEY